MWRLVLQIYDESRELIVIGVVLPVLLLRLSEIRLPAHLVDSSLTLRVFTLFEYYLLTNWQFSPSCPMR